MRLSYSDFSQTKPFFKAMGRIHLRINPFLQAFEAVEVDKPDGVEEILVAISEGTPPGIYETVPNKDKFFQVAGRCEYLGSDDELADAVFGMLREAVMLCPFQPEDHEKLDSLFREYRSSIVEG